MAWIGLILSAGPCLAQAAGGAGKLAPGDGADNGRAPPGPVAPSPGAPESSASETGAPWLLQVQATYVDQGTFRFRSPYEGPNSLNPGTRGRETFDASLFGGLKLWKGADVWIEPEIDQGFGLSDTLGVAGFPSGEAYKVGAAAPYVRLQRLFVRQSIDLGGGSDKVEADQMVFAGAQTADRLVLWAGKLSVGDVFDTNTYAHNPRGDFLNWSIIDTGTFDYAADSWGYTYGLAGEWYQGAWTTRLGLFDMSKVPNGERPDDTFTQFQIVGEVERRFNLVGKAGKLAATGYVSRARMGDFADAIRYGEAIDATPDVLAVRRYRSHAGLGFNLEQTITKELSLFARGGFADGHQQSYEFTDIDRTLSAGVSIAGKRWGRPDDRIGIAGVGNDISRDFKAYLGAGGLGILIGDGRLAHAGAEQILETFYDLAATSYARIGLDYQFVDNPAYNRDRGPVSIIAIRLHLQSNGLFR